MDEQRPLVEKLLGMVLSAPAGLVDSVVRGDLPQRIAEGRMRLENRVRVAHWIGEMAVTTGRKELGKRLAAARPTAAGPAAPAVPAHPHPPFDGYDTLPAAQIVKLLPQLPHPDLVLIRDHETAGRGRRTILNRISELLGE